MFRLFLPILWLLLCTALSAQTAGRRTTTATLDEMIRRNPVFSEAHSGFALYDIDTQLPLYGFNAERFFVPASNVKLLTFFVAQHILEKGAPAIYYRRLRDRTELWGTGYPLLLHPEFQEYDVLKPWLENQVTPLFVNLSELEAPPRYGAGWSWDDYNYGYVYERSDLPVYGNRLYLDYHAPEEGKGAALYGVPPDIAAGLIQDVNQQRSLSRKEGSNQYTIGKDFYRRGNFPMQRALSVDPAFTLRQLAAAFPNVRRGTTPRPPLDQLEEVSANLPDTLYRKLLKNSDNYLAEQLILQAAARRYGRLDESTLFDYVTDTLFRELFIGELKFADGSGLSRYNLVKPRQFAQVLLGLHQKVGRDRLTALLPAGGVDGTLKTRFANRTEPYVWAKTGSLSGVICVSGMVRCRSGRWLVFSFLHNNVMRRSREYYDEMERVLTWIHDNL